MNDRSDSLLDLWHGPYRERSNAEVNAQKLQSNCKKAAIADNSPSCRGITIGRASKIFQLMGNSIPNLVTGHIRPQLNVTVGARKPHALNINRPSGLSLEP